MKCLINETTFSTPSLSNETVETGKFGQKTVTCCETPPVMEDCINYHEPIKSHCCLENAGVIEFLRDFCDTLKELFLNWWRGTSKEQNENLENRLHSPRAFNIYEDNETKFYSDTNSAPSIQDDSPFMGLAPEELDSDFYDVAPEKPNLIHDDVKLERSSPDNDDVPFAESDYEDLHPMYDDVAFEDIALKESNSIYEDVKLDKSASKYEDAWDELQAKLMNEFDELGFEPEMYMDDELFQNVNVKEIDPLNAHIQKIKDNNTELMLNEVSNILDQYGEVDKTLDEILNKNGGELSETQISQIYDLVNENRESEQEQELDAPIYSTISLKTKKR